MPCPPSSTARARQDWAAPPGASWSARSTDSIQVSSLGAGLGAGHPGQLVLLRREQVVVVPAGQPGTGDGRAGLEQGQRVTAQVLHQVNRAEPLVRVGGRRPIR